MDLDLEVGHVGATAITPEFALAWYHTEDGRAVRRAARAAGQTTSEDFARAAAGA